MNTSEECINRVLCAAPFADNEEGLPEMCALIRALRDERDEARMKLRVAIERAKDTENILHRPTINFVAGWEAALSYVEKSMKSTLQP